jgi:hypothetical protein
VLKHPVLDRDSVEREPIVYRAFLILVSALVVLAFSECSKKKEPSRQPQRRTVELSLEELAKQDPEVKRGEVIRNMHTLKLVLEEFSRGTYGGYPSGPDITTGQVTEAMGFPATQGQTQTANSMLGSYENFVNPYRSDLPVMSVSLRDPPKWSLELLGQVVWVPVVPDGAKAAGFKAYGAGPEGFYDIVVKSFGLD